MPTRFRLLLLFSLLYLHPSLFSQEIRVISINDGAPLPFASVTNHTRPLILATDKNGLVYMTGLAEDTLSVSYIGYKTARFPWNGDKQLTIKLVPEEKLMPQITIRDCKHTKELVHQNFAPEKEGKRKKKKTETGFGGVQWGKYNDKGAKIAVRLQSSEPYAVLKDFSFWIKEDPHAPDWAVRSPLQLGLYEVVDSTLLPGTSLLDKPIFHFPQKAGKQTVILDTLRISIPPNGIYVSLQYVANEAYEWKHITKWGDSENATTLRDTTIVRYGGIIDGVRSQHFDLVFYNGIQELWSLPAGRSPGETGVHATIRCAATFRYCEDD